MGTMAADPLFERRELIRVLSVPPKYIQRNIRGVLLSQLGLNVEGKCGVEGYIQPKSSVILNHSLGKVSMLDANIQYKVQFQADICFPHKGQIFQAPVAFRSKIGLHAELSPVRVLLPRDLHIGNAEFDALTEKDEIRFEVLGAEFKQNDESIFVLGRFLEKIGGEPGITKVEETAPAELVVPTFEDGGSEIKQVKTSATTETAAAAPARRRRRLNAATTVQINGEAEPSKEGEAEGAAGATLGL